MLEFFLFTGVMGLWIGTLLIFNGFVIYFHLSYDVSYQVAHDCFYCPPEMGPSDTF